MRWPTGTDVTRLRQRADNRSRFFLGVQKGKERTDSPVPLMVGQHYAIVAADTYNAVAHTLTFNAANFLNGSDIRPNMTLAIGTLDDPFLYGSARIRLVDAGNNRLCLEPNNLDAEGYLDTGDYIYVDGVYRLYRKLPFIVNGVVYEDGNPDEGLACAAGIPGCGIVWPGNTNYYDRPVALMGSPRVAWTNETIDFYGWRSHGRGGNVIERWTWDFDGGICTGPGTGYPGSPSHPVHAKWTSAGEYIASLVVQDDSGHNADDAYGVQFNRHRAVRPVLVYDRPGGANPPYSNFEIKSLRGSYGSGWSASVEVYGTADKSEFPDNALIIIFCEDWHGGTRGSRGGWYGQENILFVGHIRANSVKVDSEKSSVSFEAQTIEQWMKDIDCWPINFWDTGDGAPDEWHEYEGMTVEDCLWFMAEMRSNLKDVTDCFFASDIDDQKLLGYLDITEDSLYSQMSDQIGSCFFGKVSASRHGSIHLFKHKNMLDLDERAWYGPPIWSFAKQDWRDELQIGEERQRDSVAQIDFVGFFYDTNGNPQDCFSLAPEHQTCFGRIEKITGILLSDDNLADAQDEANILSGLYRAWQNTRFPHIRVPAVNNRFLEPATLDYFAIELATADTVRGYDWDGKEFLCTEVSYEIDQGKGIILADVTGEASTWGPEGVAGLYPFDLPTEDAPDEPPEYWGIWPFGNAPPWVGDLEGEGEVVYFVDRGTGRLFRTRNARTSNPADVVYEDLGLIGTGNWTYWIALDEFDPWNTAMACGANGIYKSTNLDSDSPTWTQVDANDFTMGQVMSSSVQEDLWMATSTVWGGGGSATVTVYWTTDSGATPFDSVVLANDAQQNTVPSRLELSSQDDRAWVCWLNDDNTTPKVARTTDTWASHSVSNGVSKASNWPTNSYHRHTNNPPPPIVALWGGGDETEYCTNEFALCTTGTVNTGGGTHQLDYLGGYKWRDDRYWAFSEATADRFHISDDATTWTLQYTFTGSTRYVCGSRYSSDWFYATQDGTTAPLLISNDRGETWQTQTGNWADLGYNVTIPCCAVN